MQMCVFLVFFYTFDKEDILLFHRGYGFKAIALHQYKKENGYIYILIIKIISEKMVNKNS